MRKPIQGASALLAAGLVILIASSLLAQSDDSPDKPDPFFLPGMQPEEQGIEFGRVAQCRMCHAQTPNGDADPYFSWQGGLMAQAVRDPVFRAALAIANQDLPGSGEFCLRCHTPRAWLEGRSTPTDGSALQPADRNGVDCDFCHRMVDPLAEEAAALVEHVPPGRGNAMMVADPANVVRGPYGQTAGAMPHQTRQSPFHASSELCGTCHNVSLPQFAEDVTTQPPHAYGHVERTYSEWQLSAFAEEGEAGTCQSCHYPRVEGGGQASRFASPHRGYFVKHGPVGGSTWVQKAIAHLWDEDTVDREALEHNAERGRAVLRTAATLALTFTGEREARLRITNQTGHKLPTGYPEGRRMWVEARYFDADGKLLGRIGEYGEREVELEGRRITVQTLLRPDSTRVYECLPGLSEPQAERHGLEPGPSFHFVLNDVIVKDNRIPPRGFSNEKFAEHHCEPVGAEYADGQHWDAMPLELPVGTAEVRVRLMYQSVSWEYIRFLLERNRTDDWGRRLFDAYRATGQCPPEVIAEGTVTR